MNEKICVVVSSPMTVNAFLQKPLLSLCKHYEIYVVANISNKDEWVGLGDAVISIPIAIERRIKPWHDLIALWQLIALFRRHRFKSVHSVTPKAGLLAMVAAYFAGIEIRIHTFTGQVWVTRKGLSRFVLKSLDKLIAKFGTYALVDSHSQRQFLLAENVLDEAKSGVLAMGSISGVDVIRFSPNSAARERIRAEFGVADDETLFLFLGRLNRDKGILDLAAAFAAMDAESSHLLVVGPDEEQMTQQIEALTTNCKERVHFIGYSSQPEEYMAAADVLCLPSYREGFGSVIIEAAAVGIPAIASRIYGLTDAVQENQTGLLFEARDMAGLSAAMERLTSDVELRTKLGEQAQARARNEFSSEKLATAWLAFYKARI